MDVIQSLIDESVCKRYPLSKTISLPNIHGPSIHPELSSQMLSQKRREFIKASAKKSSHYRSISLHESTALECPPPPVSSLGCIRLSNVQKRTESAMAQLFLRERELREKQEQMSLETSISELQKQKDHWITQIDLIASAVSEWEFRFSFWVGIQHIMQLGFRAWWNSDRDEMLRTVSWYRTVTGAIGTVAKFCVRKFYGWRELRLTRKTEMGGK